MRRIKKHTIKSETEQKIKDEAEREKDTGESGGRLEEQY